MPSAFVVLDALPLTPNGKVDRSALSSPEYAQSRAADADAAPQDAIEQQLVDIWETVLAVPRIGRLDNFFDLGGQSLLAARLFAEIRQAFDLNLPLATLFQAPTIEALAHIIRQDEAAASWSSLVELQPDGANPPLFLVHPGGGNVLSYRELALRLGAAQPVYGLQAQGLDGQQSPMRRVEEMAAHYLRAVRSVRPQGPYVIGGLSTGGDIAWEMAQQLQAMGQDVALVVLLDTYGPGYPQLLPPAQRVYQVCRWMLRDTVTRMVRFPAKLIAALKQLGWCETCRVALRAVGWLQPTVDSDQPRSKYESLQSKMASYQRHARERRTWERYLNVAIVHLLNQSSVPDVARRFANTLNESWGDVDVQEGVPENLRVLELAINQARDAYRPRAYGGRVAYFEADRAPGIFPDPLSGWGELAQGGIEVYKVPGAHADIVYTPELAQQLGRCLQKAHQQLRHSALNTG